MRHRSSLCANTRPRRKHFVGFAVEVHRAARPGPPKSAYAECVVLEPSHTGIRFQAQITLFVLYGFAMIPFRFRSNIVAENNCNFEIKCARYLRMSIVASVC